MAYTFGTTIDAPFDDVVTTVTDALAGEGFGILSTIDVQATLKAKLDIDGPRYLILGACNPPFAHQAVTADPDIGALLPCNVVVREEDDRIAVRFMDPEAVLTLVDHPDIAEIAAEVGARLRRISDGL
jgi:uncharacterized protein (DUF302 family)